MKTLMFISTCLLTACDPEPIVDTVPIPNKIPSIIQSDKNTLESQVDVIAEAKMNTLLDIIQTDKLSLSRECTRNKYRVGLFSERFNVGSLSCETDRIKVYMGSSEIEFKLKNCKKNGKVHDNTTYVLGVISKNEFQLIDVNEEKQPLYVCGEQ
ncbi:MAG: hypothetical protein COA91_10595 [Robiginitomaculum sp.]|nr:MAG: hypothetical protein COA91_10595 [Robiginitomaculum sp.]